MSGMGPVDACRGMKRLQRQLQSIAAPLISHRPPQLGEMRRLGTTFILSRNLPLNHFTPDHAVLKRNLLPSQDMLIVAPIHREVIIRYQHLAILAPLERLRHGRAKLVRIAYPDG